MRNKQLSKSIKTVGERSPQQRFVHQNIIHDINQSFNGKEFIHENKLKKNEQAQERRYLNHYKPLLYKMNLNMEENQLEESIGDISPPQVENKQEKKEKQVKKGKVTKNKELNNQMEH